MKQTLTTMVLITLLFSGLVLGETMGDLVKLDGLYYKEFTGKITGKEQGIIKNGKREGPWIYYYDNGQVMCKGTWKDGKHQGPWVYYWDNGQVFSKGTYKDGKRGRSLDWEIPQRVPNVQTNIQGREARRYLDSLPARRFRQTS